MTFNHTHRENLVEIIKSEDYDPLIIESVDVKTDVVESESDTFDNIVGMLVYIF